MEKYQYGGQKKIITSNKWTTHKRHGRNIKKNDQNIHQYRYHSKHHRNNNKQLESGTNY